MSGASPFQASRGWFDRFKKWYGLYNVKLTGEHALADHEAAEIFPTKLAQLIEEKGYVPEQAFNTNKTGQLLKKIPRELSSQSERRQQ